MHEIIDEISGLYRVLKFKTFRKTQGVSFDQIPVHMLESIDAVDRVIHQSAAVSPGAVGEITHPWYMHPHQQDNLIVLSGTRHVELYNPTHGKIEHFIVTADNIYHDDKLICSGGAMLVWPQNVFHRIVSGAQGSISINLAVHHKGFNLKDNFSIYDVDTQTGEYTVIRAGHKDQF